MSRSSARCWPSVARERFHSSRAWRRVSFKRGQGADQARELVGPELRDEEEVIELGATAQSGLGEAPQLVSIPRAKGSLNELPSSSGLRMLRFEHFEPAAEAYSRIEPQPVSRPRTR